jgi:hypothetical protein
MPHKAPGESLSAYMDKFMSDAADRKKWPKAKQRAAVGYSEAREAKKKSKRG